ncbi:MAG: hypothetical protein JWM56_154 [Candidatus Peribacteria bacterium]|nr:hypothetical protein [Candidatus Peribacteria bacterium]
MQGTLLILGSQFAWAIGALFLKKLSGTTNPIIASTLIAFMGTIFLLPVFLLYSKDIASLTKEQWMWAGLRGILWIGIGGILFSYGLQKIELSHAAILSLTYPLFTALLAAIVLHETIGARFIIASGFFVVGYLVLIRK